MGPENWNPGPLHIKGPGREALLSGTYDKSSLKAQGYGRGRFYARHLTKRPKKRTDLAQEQHNGKGCQHLNVEPIAWQTHIHTMLSSSSPTTLTWGLTRRVTTPNTEKLIRMWRTREITSIKGGGGEDTPRNKSEEIDLSNPIHVRFGLTGQIHLFTGFHENPDQTLAQRPMAGLSKPTL